MEGRDGDEFSSSDIKQVPQYLYLESDTLSTNMQKLSQYTLRGLPAPCLTLAIRFNLRLWGISTNRRDILNMLVTCWTCWLQVGGRLESTSQ